jgi:hypothetical protein
MNREGSPALNVIRFWNASPKAVSSPRPSVIKFVVG